MAFSDPNDVQARLSEVKSSRLENYLAENAARYHLKNNHTSVITGTHMPKTRTRLLELSIKKCIRKISRLLVNVLLGGKIVSRYYQMSIRND